MLRAYMSPDQTGWNERLACTEFAINNSHQEPVMNTIFFFNYGIHLLTPVTMDSRMTVPCEHDFVQGIGRAVQQAKL